MGQRFDLHARARRLKLEASGNHGVTEGGDIIPLPNLSQKAVPWRRDQSRGPPISFDTAKPKHTRGPNSCERSSPP
ncbi:hypothetical protein AGR7C_pAt0013 [Agrobacterium deltaense Zutra 3/1]|uniref:Uncharacterized protein n=1 Tax=Agrobacterium deltaense Zutra 3/1 TaxID=1183427 RepID=A0A1S7S1D4_9HYPH|nr:hypothetical protein AGR7C_pAt0013 [Agrobacterium deltaense Zutra 3/1]